MIIVISERQTWLAQEFAELKRQNADALPFDLHQDEFQTSSAAVDGRWSTDDDEDDDLDDDEEEEDADRIDCAEDGHVPDSAAAAASSTSLQPTPLDAVPDLIPNQGSAADAVPPGSDGLKDRRTLSSSSPLRKGRPDDGGRSSPLRLHASKLLPELLLERSDHLSEHFFH